MFYQSGVQKSDVYKRDVFCDVMEIPQSCMATAKSWPPVRDIQDTVNPPRALTNQQCSLATGYGIKVEIIFFLLHAKYFWNRN